MTGILIGIVLLCAAWLEAPESSALLKELHAVATADPWNTTFVAAMFVGAGILDLTFGYESER